METMSETTKKTVSEKISSFLEENVDLGFIVNFDTLTESIIEKANLSELDAHFALTSEDKLFHTFRTVKLAVTHEKILKSLMDDAEDIPFVEDSIYDDLIESTAISLVSEIPLEYSLSELRASAFDEEYQEALSTLNAYIDKTQNAADKLSADLELMFVNKSLDNNPHMANIIPLHTEVDRLIGSAHIPVDFYYTHNDANTESFNEYLNFADEGINLDLMNFEELIVTEATSLINGDQKKVQSVFEQISEKLNGTDLINGTADETWNKLVNTMQQQVG